MPSWRPDVEDKADLVEEIVRIAGPGSRRFRAVPREAAIVATPVLTLLQKRTRTAKRALAARGMLEAVTWSFISKAEAEAFGGGGPELALANPIASELSDMRPSLLPGLLKAAQRNADRGYGDAALFEVGQVFRGEKPEDQFTAAPAIRRGLAQAEGAGRHWSTAAKAGRRVRRKGRRHGAAGGARRADGRTAGRPGGPAWYHPGRSATLQFGPKVVIGSFGELHPRILEALDVKGPLVASEILLDALPPPKAKPTRMKPKLVLSDFSQFRGTSPSSCRRSTPAADILKAVQAADRNAEGRGRIRSLRRRRDSRRSEVGRRNSDAAAARKDADGRRNRRDRGKNRNRGYEEDRCGTARLISRTDQLRTAVPFRGLSGSHP